MALGLPFEQNKFPIVVSLYHDGYWYLYQYDNIPLFKEKDNAENWNDKVLNFFYYGKEIKADTMRTVMDYVMGRSEKAKEKVLIEKTKGPLPLFEKKEKGQMDGQLSLFA